MPEPPELSRSSANVYSPYDRLRLPAPGEVRPRLIDRGLARLRETHEELATAGHVLITGAGPVGLELAGEIKAVWPERAVTIVDPAPTLLPGFAPELRLGTSLAEQPPVEPGRTKTFTVRTSDGEVTADIWFRCYGVRVESDFFSGELAAARDPQGRVRVDAPAGRGPGAGVRGRGRYKAADLLTGRFAELFGTAPTPAPVTG